MACERYRSPALSGHGVPTLVLLAFLGLALVGNAAVDSSREEISGHARYLASDELAGRAPGNPGIDKARDYISQQFKAYGLEPGGEKGTYFQGLNVPLGVRVKEPSSLILGDDPPLRLFTDWVALGFSGSGKIEGDVVFAGYGITAKEHGYDDYAGLDVEGKIVLVLRYEPPPRSDTSPFRKSPTHSRYAALRLKADNARRHGAIGMILVDLDSPENEAQKMMSTLGASGRVAPDFIAVQVRQRIIEKWLQDAAISLPAIKARIDQEERPVSVNLRGLKAAIDVSLEKIEARTQNVVGYVPGSDPKTKCGNIIIGAHYDHIGLGNVGIRAASHEGKIHNGADDNASGTAVLLSLARRLSESRDKLPCSVVFVAFTGEELGLHGSKRYVNDPTFPLQGTRAMINLDMVGRMRGHRLTVLGVDTAREFRAWIADGAKKLGIEIIPDERTAVEYGDHIPFYEQNIPVLAFFTGMHEDYHQPTDDWEKLNAEGMQMVRDLVLDLTQKIASEKEPPVFVRRSSRPGRSDR